MTDQSLFDENKEPATQPTEVEANAGGDTPPAEPEGTPSTGTGLEDLLSNIRNEKGEPKYRDVQTALDALKHSQEYIPQLQSQYKELEERYNQLATQTQERESVEEIVNRLASQSQPTEQAEPAAQSGFSEEDIQKLVSQHLEQRESAARVQANQKQVSDALQERYGDKAAEVLESKANELGLSKTDLGEWASRSPAAVLALFGGQKAPTHKPSSSSVSIPPINPSATEIPKPSKSMLLGATSKDQAGYIADIRKAVHARLGITE